LSKTKNSVARWELNHKRLLLRQPYAVPPRA